MSFASERKNVVAVEMGPEKINHGENSYKLSIYDKKKFKNK